jgi:hypothetical protein
MLGRDINSNNSGGSGGWRYDDWGGLVDVSDTCYQLSSATQNSGATWSENFATNRYRFDWS